MIQLKIDPSTGDLAVAPNGWLQLVGTPGQVTPAVLAQKLRIRLSLLQGEYVLDQSVGIPWLQAILGKGTQGAATAILRRAITTCAGVASLVSFSLTVSDSRVASVSFTVTTATGEEVSITDFVWSAPTGGST